MWVFKKRSGGVLGPPVNVFSTFIFYQKPVVIVIKLHLSKQLHTANAYADAFIFSSTLESSCNKIHFKICVLLLFSDCMSILLLYSIATELPLVLKLAAQYVSNLIPLYLPLINFHAICIGLLRHLSRFHQQIYMTRVGNIPPQNKDNEVA